MANRGVSQSYLSWVYWGTLISSLGTYTFPGATIGIMTQLDFPLWQIGLLMTLTRLGTLIGNFFFGDLSDRYDTKMVILGTEIAAFLLSVFLILSWRLGSDHFLLFSILVFLRFIVISVGGPSRNKIVKLLSDEYKKDHFQSGIVLNVVTYGPSVVGSFIGFLAVKYLSYEWVLTFDALTFIANGYILVFLVKYSSPDTLSAQSNLIYKIKLYLSHKKLALMDMLVAIPFMGTNVLMSRLSGGVGERVPLLLMTFGLGVLISFPLLKRFRSKKAHITSYIALLFSFVFLIFSQKSFPLIMAGVLVRNISYWYIFNFYTGLFQEKEPGSSIASLFAARSFVGTFTLGLGELLFGFFGEFISLQWDLGIRALLTAVLLIIVIKSNDVSEVKSSC